MLRTIKRGRYGVIGFYDLMILSMLEGTLRLMLSSPPIQYRLRAHISIRLTRLHLCRSPRLTLFLLTKALYGFWFKYIWVLNLSHYSTGVCNATISVTVQSTLGLPRRLVLPVPTQYLSGNDRYEGHTIMLFIRKETQSL